jgi:zinc/manganese transport system substrate-binding protein
MFITHPPRSRRFLLQALSSITLATAMLGTAAAQSLPVTASFSILGDWVKVVGAERVTVTSLVGADQDAHVFEPKPTDAKAIKQSKLLVINGMGFEPWAQKLAKSANYQGVTLVASNGIKPLVPNAEKGKHHDHAEADPHAWQNPQNVIVYINNIAGTLSKLDPAGASSYQSNAQAYIKELQALDAWAQEQFASIPADKRKVITSHDAFGYFAARYNIQFLAAQGTSTEAEPSAKQVAKLIKQIQREKIKTVYVENMSNPKLLAQLSKDTGASVGASLYADALSAPDQSGATYLKMMRHNVSQLAAGMR